GQDGRDEEEQLVDETGGEKSRGEGRSALQQQRLDALRRERAQLLVERTGAQLELRPFPERTATEGESPRLPGGTDIARVESRCVGPHCPHSDRDRVRSRAELVHPTPRLVARHPAPAGNGDAPVEGDRGLVGDERTAERLPDAPRLVLATRGEVV